MKRNKNISAVSGTASRKEAQKSNYYALKPKSNVKDQLNKSENFLQIHKTFDSKPKSFTAKNLNNSNFR